MRTTRVEVRAKEHLDELSPGRDPKLSHGRHGRAGSIGYGRPAGIAAGNANACSDTACSPFDNRRLQLRTPEGGLRPLPPADSGVAPWTNEALIFHRDAASGTQRMMAAAFGVPAERWAGAPLASSGALVSALAVADPAST